MAKLEFINLKKGILHLLYWLIVWFFFFAFFSVGSQNENFIFWFSSILSVITIVASYQFIFYLIPNYLIEKRYTKFTLYASYAFVFIVCAVLMTVIFGFVFFFNLEFQKMPALTKNSGVIVVCVLLIVVLSSSVKILMHNYKSIDEKKTLENKFLQMQLQLKEQELKFLKMQIHPHFLFNTLNTLYGFALKKSDQAPDMILKLSNLLDYILYQVDKPLVLLKDEITHIKDYLALEKSRFQQHLQVNFNLKNIDENVQVPPMLLLPYVENAFKHGTQIDGVLRVKIELNLINACLLFRVKNTSSKKENTTKGLGLENIKKRLAMLYNKNAFFEINQTETSFEINLKILLKNEA